MPFFTYILRCSDHSLYISHTHALSARLRAHNDGLGTRFISRPDTFRASSQSREHARASADRRMNPSN